MEAMQEVSEDEMCELAPGLGEATKRQDLGEGDSYLRLVLEVLGQGTQTFARGSHPASSFPA